MLKFKMKQMLSVSKVLFPAVSNFIEGNRNIRPECFSAKSIDIIIFYSAMSN